MADFKAIETQEELDKIIGERLKRERKQVEDEFSEKISALEKENEGLKSENAEVKSSLEKVAEKDTEIEQLQGRVKGYEKSEMQRKVALAHNIPYNLAARIQGETEDEMTEDAKALAKYFDKQDPVPPLKNPEMRLDGGGAYRELLDGLNLDD